MRNSYLRRQVQQLTATVRALTAPAADGTPDWLRPLDLLERIHAGFLLVCVRQAPDLDLRCDERLAYGLAALTRALSHEPPRDELLRLAEEYQRTTPAVGQWMR